MTRAGEVVYECVDSSHDCTRTICACDWFDGACHECPSPEKHVIPPCMEVHRG